MELISASRCPRCERVVTPPARYCPDHPVAMEPTELRGYGELVAYTTLYSPPEGFRSPLHIALVELPEGARFFCHGTETKRIKVGSRVAVEQVDNIYYFSHLGLAERARLFWRRAGDGGQRMAAMTKSAVKRLFRRSPSEEG